MFVTQKNKKTFGLSALAGIAGVMLSGSAALAAPLYAPQGVHAVPQTAPVVTERHVYTHTEVTPVPEAQYQYSDNDRHYQASTTGNIVNDTMAAATINPNNIRYMSGGIGEDEQMRFKAAESDYPVKVVFANSNGAFKSDVDVTVKDAAGETVLGLQTDGPVLLMDLEPGSYTLSANDGDEVKTQKLNVSSSTRTYTLHFKANEPLGYDGTAG